MIDLKQLDRETLLAMYEAGKFALECERVLAKTGHNLVGELLKGQGTFYQLNHYPDGDVYDHETHSQYYYHAHRTGEHGHFHTFLRPKGMPEAIKPQPVADYIKPKDDNAALSHIVAISMDSFGHLRGLFTTNRWVTAEYWYSASDVAKMIDCFEIDHAQPSWPVNRWIGAVLKLYKPQIIALLEARDKSIADWMEKHPDRNVFEDRELEITSEYFSTVDDQIYALEKALGK